MPVFATKHLVLSGNTQPDIFLATDIKAGVAVAADGTYSPEAGKPVWQDTALWVLIPVLIVLALFLKAGIPGKIAQMLDARGKKINDELEEARALREEAQEILAQFQRRQRQADEEAQAIITQAKADATRLCEEARTKLEAQLERRTKAVQAKIARAQNQALADIRNQTADKAIAAAEEIIKQRLDTVSQNALADKAIVDIRTKLQ